MGGVDTYDQMLKSYFIERKSKRWTYKFSIYIINLLLHNSYIFYKTFYNGNNKLNSQLKYRMQIFDILTKDRIIISENPNVNIENHLPEKFLDKKYKRCKFCSKKSIRKSTLFFCSVCKVSLCIDPCFKDWHACTIDESSSTIEVTSIYN